MIHLICHTAINVFLSNVLPQIHQTINLCRIQNSACALTHYCAPTRTAAVLIHFTAKSAAAVKTVVSVSSSYLTTYCTIWSLVSLTQISIPGKRNETKVLRLSKNPLTTRLIYSTELHTSFIYNLNVAAISHTYMVEHTCMYHDLVEIRYMSMWNNIG